MKRIFYLLLGISFLGSILACAKTNTRPAHNKPTVLLMVTEQNIEGPQRAWWASEIDLSTVEANIAQTIAKNGYAVIDPLELKQTLKEEKAFTVVNITDEESLKLAKLKNVDYVVLGKAVASSGGTILNSKMYSCFANATVKVLDVKTGKIISYLDATASSPHTDVVTGGKKALAKTGIELGEKIINILSKKGGN